MDKKLDFIDVFASAIHDAKNSLGLLSNTLEDIVEKCERLDVALADEFNLLKYEIKRLTHNQVRLLALYKAERSQFAVNVDYHAVQECIEEAVLQNEPILRSRGIEIEVDCPDMLFWTLDRGLVCGILDNLLTNALRYTRDRIRISAAKKGDYLSLTVEDNGPGYPGFMLLDTAEGGIYGKNIDFKTGSTALGIYFAELVAGSHRKRDKRGHISIANGGALGGGVFAIYLP